MGLQEKMVMEDLYSETAIPSVYLARRKWVKIEKVDRTRPNNPTHLSFDLKTTALPSPAPPPLAGRTHFMVEFSRAVTRSEGENWGQTEREREIVHERWRRCEDESFLSAVLDWRSREILQTYIGLFVVLYVYTSAYTMPTLAGGAS